MKSLLRLLGGKKLTEDRSGRTARQERSEIERHRDSQRDIQCGGRDGKKDIETNRKDSKISERERDSRRYSQRQTETQRR